MSIRLWRPPHKRSSITSIVRGRSPYSRSVKYRVHPAPPSYHFRQSPAAGPIASLAFPGGLFHCCTRAWSTDFSPSYGEPIPSVIKPLHLYALGEEMSRPLVDFALAIAVCTIVTARCRIIRAGGRPSCMQQRGAVIEAQSIDRTRSSSNRAVFQDADSTLSPDTPVNPSSSSSRKRSSGTQHRMNASSES